MVYEHNLMPCTRDVHHVGATLPDKNRLPFTRRNIAVIPLVLAPYLWTKPASLAIVWRMIDPKLIDELTTRLSATMPSGIQALQADVVKNMRATLESGLAKLDLVTREEFEVQSAVLARTREKLAGLEAQIKALEEKTR